MQIIQNNPYRTVGLLVGATAREQERQVKRLKQFLEAEQDPQGDFSFPTLGNLHRTLDKVDEAASKLNLDSDKINAALFWFWNGNPITDEAAFDALKIGDIETANNIWGKLVFNTDEDGNKIRKSITEKNFSAHHNYFILNTINVNGNLLDAILCNLFLIESVYIINFIKNVTDETFKISKKDLQLIFLKNLYKEIETNHNNFLDIFMVIINKHEFSCKDEIHKHIIQQATNKFEHIIEIAKNKRKINKAEANVYGQNLFLSTYSELDKLKIIINENDLRYITLVDKVSSEILQCSIDFFNSQNKLERSNEIFEIAIEIAQKADKIAISKLLKDRIYDNIEALNQMRDGELRSALSLLNSIKDTFNKNKDETIKSLSSIKDQKNIDWKKVNKHIHNSIDWQKVVLLVLQVIPYENILKIKNYNNQLKIAEYKALVNFLIDKLNFSQRKKIKYLVFWEDKNSFSYTRYFMSNYSHIIKIILVLGIIGGLFYGSYLLFGKIVIVILEFFSFIVVLNIANYFINGKK